LQFSRDPVNGVTTFFHASVDILRTDWPTTDWPTTDWPTTDWPTTDLSFREFWYIHMSSDPLHVWFYGRVFGVSRSNGTTCTSGWTYRKKNYKKTAQRV